MQESARTRYNKKAADLVILIKEKEKEKETE
jgi:hypothetical protein